MRAWCWWCKVSGGIGIRNLIFTRGSRQQTLSRTIPTSNHPVQPVTTSALHTRPTTPDQAPPQSHPPPTHRLKQQPRGAQLTRWQAPTSNSSSSDCTSSSPWPSWSSKSPTPPFPLSSPLPPSHTHPLSWLLVAVQLWRSEVVPRERLADSGPVLAQGGVALPSTAQQRRPTHGDGRDEGEASRKTRCTTQRTGQRPLLRISNTARRGGASVEDRKSRRSEEPASSVKCPSVEEETIRITAQNGWLKCGEGL